MAETHPIQSQMLALSVLNRCSEAEVKLTEHFVQTNGILGAKTKLLLCCNYGSVKTGHVRIAVKDNQRNKWRQRDRSQENRYKSCWVC